MTIYEIDAKIAGCITDDGEIINIELFDALQIERGLKIENVACWYKNLLADAESISIEGKILKERETRIRSKADSLKMYLTNVLLGEKFNSPRAAINWRRSDETVINDEDTVPMEFKNAKITYTPDKTRIKAAILAGQAVPGAAVVPKNNIQIK